MLLCLLAVGVFLSLAMAGAWAWAWTSGRSGMVDAIWSLSVGVACLMGALWPAWDAPSAPRRWIVAAMVAAWSARLGGYILGRSLGAEDDPRYAALKAQWGDDAGRRLFGFLQAQALAAWPLAGAVMLAAHGAKTSLGFLDGLGVLVFAAGLGTEALADAQMARFRATPGPRGRICDVGLWGYSRHPNYFGEWLCWLGYALIAFDAGAPTSWLAFAAPLTTYGLLVLVSGIPPLEAHLARSRPEAFAAYAARVSAFWPLPPRI